MFVILQLNFYLFLVLLCSVVAQCPCHFLPKFYHVRRYTWLLQNVSGIILFLRNTKQYNHLTYISLKIFPFCNYTLLSTTVKLLETFLEAILCTPFRLFHRIFNDVSMITTAPSLQCWFQSRERVNIRWNQVRRIWGVLQCCEIVRC